MAYLTDKFFPENPIIINLFLYVEWPELFDVWIRLKARI